MAEHIPDVYQHLSNLGIVSMIGISWFLTLFLTPMNHKCAAIIVDCFLWEGPKVLFQVGLTILHLNREALLLAQDDGEAMDVLTAFLKAVDMASPHSQSQSTSNLSTTTPAAATTNTATPTNTTTTTTTTTANNSTSSSTTTAGAPLQASVSNSSDDGFFHVTGSQLNTPDSSSLTSVIMQQPRNISVEPAQNDTNNSHSNDVDVDVASPENTSDHLKDNSYNDDESDSEMGDKVEVPNKPPPIHITIRELMRESYERFGFISARTVESMRNTMRVKVVQGFEDASKRSMLRSVEGISK